MIPHLLCNRIGQVAGWGLDRLTTRCQTRLLKEEMKTKAKNWVCLVGCLLLALAAPAAGWAKGKAFQVGVRLPALTLVDQHGASLALGPGVRTLLFSREMASKDLIQELLTAEGAGFLSEHEAVYLVDISGMPSLITKMFALPKMREYPFRLFLDDDGSQTERIPVEPGKVTLLYLEDRTIKAIRHLAEKDEIR